MSDRNHARIVTRALALGIVSVSCMSVFASPPEIAPAAALDLADLRGVALDDLPVGSAVQVAGVTLGSPARGVPARDATLMLTRFTVLNPDATVIAQGDNGVTSIDTSAVVLLGGEVEGEPGTTAYIGLSEAGVFGFVRAPEGMYSISTGDFNPANPAEPLPVTVAHTEDLPQPDAQIPQCGFHPADNRLDPAGAWQIVPDTQLGASSRGMPCRSVDIAIDTDWEFTNRLFGNNAGVAAQYALVLLGGVGQIYKSELNVRLSTNYVRTWSSNSDPYNQGADLLDEFSAHWGSTKADVPRELAHLFSGRTNLSYGGVAYLSGICEQWGYGVSGYLNGWFPTPLVNRHGGNWDLMVVAHEMGHNFGSGHTHDSYTPVIDGCGNGDCTLALGGTIMSYCHTCAGGMTNIDLVFGPRVQERILSYLDTRACVINAPGDRVAVNDTATTVGGGVVDVHVLNNDSDSSCLTADIISFSSTSAHGGTVTLVSPSPGATQHLVRKYLRYTAPAGYSGLDTFSYTITGGSSATVTATVLGLRPADHPVSTEPGASVQYFEVPFRYNLPNFATLTPYASGTVSALNFAVNDTQNLPGTGRKNEVGMVYDGYVMISTPGFYTLTIASDDGSKLWIGDTLIVDNNGRHTLKYESGQIGLDTGLHRIRVEYYEASGPAALQVRFASGTVPDQPIPASAWFHAPPCAADVNGDTTPDILDFLDYLDAFGACENQPAPCAGSSGIGADFNGDTFVDVLDFLDFIDAFGNGC